MTTAATPGFAARLIVVARDIKLSHTIFALPFALLATFLAAATDGRLPYVSELLLILGCMVLARTTAMAVNRWADARLDADNPRTAGRAVPNGRVSRSFMLGAALACAAGFIALTGGFWLLHHNPWPTLLAPAVLLWLAAYSYTKRFTWLCHLILGSALALSPLAAAIAVRPQLVLGPNPIVDIYLLAGMVMCWVAGFDIIYALQDVAVDRSKGIYSMPAKLGVEPALWVSRLLHVLSAAALVYLWQLSPSLGTGFVIGVAIVAGLLVLEHALVWSSSTHHMHTAFFTLNGVISLLLGTLGIIDVVLALPTPLAP